MGENKSAIFCNHANEVPNICPCSADCYCKGNTCPTTISYERLEKELADLKGQVERLSNSPCTPNADKRNMELWNQNTSLRSQLKRAVSALESAKWWMELGRGDDEFYEFKRKQELQEIIVSLAELKKEG